MSRKTLYEIAKREAEISGLTVEKCYVRAMEEVRIREVLPTLSRAVFNKKYLLPNYRQQDYYTQDACNCLSVDLLTGIALRILDPDKKDHVLSTHYICMIRQLEFNRPTFFLERELARPMLKTKLPSNLRISDLKWRFPAFKVYLPKGTLQLVRDGYKADLMFLDVAKSEDDAIYKLPESIEQELYREFKCPRIPVVNCGVKGFNAAGNLDFENPEGPVGYAGNSSLLNLTLGNLLEKASHDLNPQNPSDDIDNRFVTDLLRLSVNCLLFLGQIPIEKQAEKSDVIRPPRQEGKHHITGLYRAKFMGETHLRAYHPSKPHSGEHELTGVKMDSQWRSGHWKRVWYGHKKGEWRLQWIPLYGTGEHKGMDKPDEKN